MLVPLCVTHLPKVLLPFIITLFVEKDINLNKTQVFATLIMYLLTSKKVSPNLPDPKMLFLSMDSKLLSRMHNAHVNTYVVLAFTKS